MLQALWAAHLFAAERVGTLLLPLGVSLDVLRSLAWLYVLARALSSTFRQGVVGRLPGLVIGLGAALLLAIIVIMTALYGERGRDMLTAIWSWSGLLLSIGGLALVEQCARNTREDTRWELKPVWLAIGVMLAFDLAFWSVTLLGEPVGQIAVARAVVNLLAAMLLGVGLRRLESWSPRLFRTSGELLLNTTLVVAGCYVLAMSLASSLLRADVEASGELVQAIFLAASIVVLSVALFSEQFRAWFRVTISKLVLPLRYDYRDGWLKLTSALSDESDVPLHDRVPRAVAALVNSGSACLWLRDAEGVIAPAGGNRTFARDAERLSEQFLEFARTREWIFDLEAMRRGTASREPLPAAPAWLLQNPDAWLVLPLVCNDALVGLVVIGRPLAPKALDWEQRDLLRVAARQVASYLAFELAANRLAELHQFEALNRLSGFVMHDLRHLVAQLALVVDNAARHRHNPEFIDDAILTIDSSVKRMTTLMETLRAGVVVEPERRLDLVEACREICARLAVHTPPPQLDAAAGSVDVMASRDRLVQAPRHLVRNAQQATAASGTVTIRVGRGSHRAEVDIVDTGVGMDAEFVRTRLFKPFDSTKGDAGMGLGAYEARDIIRKLGGTLTVDSAPGCGTTLHIELPLAPALAAGSTTP